MKTTYKKAESAPYKNEWKQSLHEHKQVVASKNEEAKLRNLLDDAEGIGGDIGDIPVVEDVGIIPTALAEEQRHRRRSRSPDRHRRRRPRQGRLSHWSETVAGEGWFSGCESSGGAGSCDSGEEAGMSDVGNGVLGWRGANSGLWEVFLVFEV